MTEVFISAAYVFLVVTYLASSGTEAISSLFRWRSNLLFNNLKTILNDKLTGLATTVYANPLVHPRLQGNDPADLNKRLPAYIEPTNFAIALSMALRLEQPRLDSLKDRSLTLTEIEEWIRVEIPPLQHEPRLTNLLAGTIQLNNADLDAIRTSIAQWYVQATERISGAYKRRTQLTSFLIALVIAVVFDVSPLPPSVAQLTQSEVPPTSALAASNGIPAAPLADTAIGSKAPLVSGQAANVGTGAPQAGTRNGAPSDGPAVKKIWTTYFKDTGVLQFVGWLITALSTLLGAPFWFGLLSKITNPRGAGSASDEKQKSASATSPPTGTATSGGTTQTG